MDRVKDIGSNRFVITCYTERYRLRYCVQKIQTRAFKALVLLLAISVGILQYENFGKNWTIVEINVKTF